MIKEDKSKLGCIASKSFLLDAEVASLLEKLQENLAKVSDYCTCAPGVVTGANDFFVVDAVKIAELKLVNHSIPILKKGSFLSPEPIFTKDSMDAISEVRPSYLLNLKDIDIEKLPPELAAYLETGEKRGLKTRFKCRTREPWFGVPLVKTGEGFIFKRTHNFHRLCVNDANVLTTDAAYQIKMTGDHKIQDLCFSFYNSLTILFAESGGRFYGGGVLELTPVEFRNLPLAFHRPRPQTFKNFISTFPKSSDFSKHLFRFGDGWLKQKLGLTSRQIDLIQEALVTLRDHRLRHGRAR